MWTVLAWIGGAAISLVSLKYSSIPYLWIFLAAATALYVTAAVDKRRRASWFNVGCLAIGLAIFEYYLWTGSIRGIEARQIQEAEQLHASHAALGWIPKAGAVASERLSFEGELIYDATYSIGPNGLRVSSPAARDPDPSAECILFFGDSFTFGQGLEDDQTLPFLVHEKTSQRYRTYNFGVKGYGAHQMLAALQQGLVFDAAPCDRTQVSHIFYQGITDHVRRAAGRVWWEAYGPRYILTEDGGVRRDGSFEDNDGYAEGRSLMQLVGTQFFKSMIYQGIVQGRYVRKYSRYHTDLFLAIVEEAQEAAHSNFPAAEFHVLLWDEENLDNRTIREGLRQRDVDVHLMSEILPNYRPDQPNLAYRLHETDAHPNALANELIAQYVVGQILPQPPSAAVN
jgi:hypothetical protein